MVIYNILALLIAHPRSPKVALGSFVVRLFFLAKNAINIVKAGGDSVYKHQTQMRGCILTVATLSISGARSV